MPFTIPYLELLTRTSLSNREFQLKAPGLYSAFLDFSGAAIERLPLYEETHRVSRIVRQLCDMNGIVTSPRLRRVENRFDTAFVPLHDTLLLPDPETFRSDEAYVGLVSHEVGHLIAEHNPLYRRIGWRTSQRPIEWHADRLGVQIPQTPLPMLRLLQEVADSPMYQAVHTLQDRLPPFLPDDLVERWLLGGTVRHYGTLAARQENILLTDAADRSDVARLAAIRNLRTDLPAR